MNNNKNNDKNPIELQISESFYSELFEKVKTLLKIDKDAATYDVKIFSLFKIGLFKIPLLTQVYDEISRNSHRFHSFSRAVTQGFFPNLTKYSNTTSCYSER